MFSREYRVPSLQPAPACSANRTPQAFNTKQIRVRNIILQDSQQRSGGDEGDSPLLPGGGADLPGGRQVSSLGHSFCLLRGCQRG